LHKLIALTIALATAGAQVVCACTSPPNAHQPPLQIAQGCAAEKECCRKAQVSKPPAPAKQEPCDQCNLKHRAEQAMPDKHDGMSAPQSAALAIPVPVVADIAPVQPRFDQAAPLPPLLKDLFHVHSLLLN
jgi:hypothetical protein